jgi:hypothetical protein
MSLLTRSVDDFANGNRGMLIGYPGNRCKSVRLGGYPTAPTNRTILGHSRVYPNHESTNEVPA